MVQLAWWKLPASVSLGKLSYDHIFTKKHQQLVWNGSDRAGITGRRTGKRNFLVSPRRWTDPVDGSPVCL